MAECLEVQEDEAVDSDRLIDRQNFKIQQVFYVKDIFSSRTVAFFETITNLPFLKFGYFDLWWRMLIAE